MNFIVPTDFSTNAKNAVQYAAALAQATNSGIRLLYIVSPPLIGSDKRNFSYKKKVTDAIKEAEIKLEELCREIKTKYVNIKCDYIVRVAETVDGIIAAAVGNEADFIIMGTRGAGLIKKTFWGSNTATVIENSSLPVLAIPEKAPFLPPNKIVFATNFHDSDLKDIKQLSAIASAFGADIIIVHIVENNEGIESELSMIEYFSGLVRKATAYPRISYRVFRNENTEKGIELFIDSVGADLLALSTRDRNPFEKLFSKSITKELSFHSKIPLLSFRVQETNGDSDF